VHKHNLAALSLIFRDMFHIGDSRLSEKEIVQLSEPSAVLEVLIAMCYPAEEPPYDIGKLPNDVVADCYEATVKYGMWVAGLALRSFITYAVLSYDNRTLTADGAFRPLIASDPFRVVRLAHNLNDSALLADAVRATLDVDILTDTPALRAKTGPLWPDLVCKQ
jgi:hypothetical protein